MRLLNNETYQGRDKKTNDFKKETGEENLKHY